MDEGQKEGNYRQNTNKTTTRYKEAEDRIHKLNGNMAERKSDE